MNEQAPPEEMPQFHAPRRRNILLIILVGVLATSCLVLGIGAWFLQRPGKPIPPEEFIGDETAGLAVLKLDANQPQLRELLAYAATVAADQNLKTDFDDWIDFFRSRKAEAVPKVTLVGSYSGSEPENLHPWAALVLSEMPGGIRWQVQGAYFALGREVDSVEHQGAKIVSGRDLAERLQQESEKQGQPAEEPEDDEAVPEPSFAPILKASYLSVFKNVVYVGETEDDVEAAISAYNAPLPDGEDAPEAALEFAELLAKADSSAMLFGAASNENGILLAAIFRDETRRSEARDKLKQALAMDPNQIKRLAFSAAFVTADELAVNLWLEAANDEAARQVDVAVRSFIDSQVNTTEELPLNAAIVDGETSIEGAIYKGKVKVTGLKKLVQQRVTDLYDRLREEQLGQEPEPPDENQPLPDEGAAPQPDDDAAPEPVPQPDNADMAPEEQAD